MCLSRDGEVERSLWYEGAGHDVEQLQVPLIPRGAIEPAGLLHQAPENGNTLHIRERCSTRPGMDYHTVVASHQHDLRWIEICPTPSDIRDLNHPSVVGAIIPIANELWELSHGK